VEEADLKPVVEAAQEFGISPDVIWKYIRLGKLRAYRKPMKERRILVDREEIKRLMRPVRRKP
jgi:predicted site-specific integrase-resolvase